MPRINAVRESEPSDSFIVSKVSGLFDIPPTDKLRVEFNVEVPGLDEDWSIGLIVGPSGSGKSTIADEAFGLPEPYKWTRQPVVEDMGNYTAEEITSAMISVGFSSPPAWLRPHGVLSNGEKFRCEMARMLLSDDELIVIDEFTSVVDRQVAQTASIAIAKTIRKRNRRMVAVTCHYDVADYLEADWVLDMATGDLSRGRVQRETIEFKLYRCEVDAWRMFEHHHYLTGTISRASQCYMATVDDKPAGFVAALSVIGKKGCWRLSRSVVLPDYQGVGVGSWMTDEVCSIYKRRGNRVYTKLSHPALIRHRMNSDKWVMYSVTKNNHAHRHTEHRNVKSAVGRATASFEYIGD
jgi:ABC-type lipoprotein export system ATPase subunit